MGHHQGTTGKMSVAVTPHLRWGRFALTAGSLLAIGLATLWPEQPGPVQSHACLLCGSFGTVDAVLNVFLFVPLGAALSLHRASFTRAVITACLLSILIETAQLFVIPGRDAALGDILANTLGGALGFALGRHWRMLYQPTGRQAESLALSWSVIWLCVQLVSSYAFQASIPDGDYYGQVAPTLGGFDTFSGRVLSARVGDMAIAQGLIPKSDSLRQTLLAGGPLAATAIPGTVSQKFAPILRLADGSRREIGLIAQSGTGFVFSVRSGAAALRLRQPLFAIDDVFRLPVGAKQGPVRFSGRYRRGAIDMQAAGDDGVRVAHFPMAASSGWTLWLPFAWVVEGTPTERLASEVWLAVWVFPLGFWLVLASRGGDPSSRWRFRSVRFAAYASIVAIGLVGIPRAFGIAAPSLADWVAVLAGFGCGVLLARSVRTGGPRPA